TFLDDHSIDIRGASVSSSKNHRQRLSSDTHDYLRSLCSSRDPLCHHVLQRKKMIAFRIWMGEEGRMMISVGRISNMKAVCMHYDVVASLIHDQPIPHLSDVSVV
ncbi:hypothetical protein PFISCL1PPCAC_2813, partial [Pristionchus fissidentatus]